MGSSTSKEQPPNVRVDRRGDYIQLATQSNQVAKHATCAPVQFVDLYRNRVPSIESKPLTDVLIFADCSDFIGQLAIFFDVRSLAECRFKALRVKLGIYENGIRIFLPDLGKIIGQVFDSMLQA